MAEEKLEFTVDSALLGELGERLVTRNYIALAELVKNAYDADATQITIRFINLGWGKGEIHLIDNGYGMTFKEVKDYWMRVATPIKLREPISPLYGRKKSGSKGIGRFSCRRIAKKLILETIAEISGSKEYEWTKVKFDWEEDFKPGTTLTEIPCKFERKKLREGKPGLTLKLIDLNDSWTEQEFNLLRRQILTLSIVKGIRRESFNEDPGFEAVFDAPEFSKGAGVLVDQFMDAGWGKLEGAIEKDGIVDLKLEAKKIGTRRYELPQKFEILGDVVQFEIAWVPIKREYYRDTTTITKGLAKSVMIEQGGVRVYLDGFRVYPYGDPKNDWLGIDQDVARRWGLADRILDSVASELGVDSSRAMLNHPRNQNLIGIINISSIPKMPLQVKLDRMGFVENEATDNLIEVIRLSLQWMVLHYNNFLILHESEALREAEKDLRGKIGAIKEEKSKLKSIATPLVEEAVSILSLEASRAHGTLSEDERKESLERVGAASRVIQRSFSLAETHLGILRAVASTGALMFVFTHEIKGIIAKLDTHANTLDRIIEEIPVNERGEFSNFAQSLRDTRDRFDKQIRLFGIMAQKAQDTDRKEISVGNTCNEVADCFEYLIEHYNLNKPEIDVPETLRTGPMLDAEFFSIIVNLVSNAIKATIAGLGKNILIRGRKESGKTFIRVFDDGLGLPEEFREEVFQPLTADPDGRLYKRLQERIQDEDLAPLGRGSGLGLNIVRGITETYEGKVHFVDVESPWKTCVEVVLP
ncbi:MAG TPA: ATP-binding protein [Desulfobacteria bacterium]|nr:ATP-binding protein [Desulfobacteria bacterium]